MLMAGEVEPAAADPEVVRLVALARTGDPAAFGRLINGHLGAARRVALAAVGQPMDADEAVQEASVAAWTRLDALHDPAAFGGWFMRIVWRKAPLLDDTMAIARQIADALESAHECGIIHRDLKPANVKVKEDGTVQEMASDEELQERSGN